MTCPKWALFQAGDGPKVPDAPYPAHYRRALAFSDILSPLGHRHPLRGSYRSKVRSGSHGSYRVPTR